MVRLLECQACSKECIKEDLKAFAIIILCHMLEIFESDLSTSEMTDLDHFITDWCSK